MCGCLCGVWPGVLDEYAIIYFMLQLPPHCDTQQPFAFPKEEAEDGMETLDPNWGSQVYFILYAIAGLDSLSISSVLKTLHADFRGSWTSLHPHQYPRVSGPMTLELQAAESECWETHSGPLKHTLNLRAILPTPKKFAFLKWLAMQTFFLC